MKWRLSFTIRTLLLITFMVGGVVWCTTQFNVVENQRRLIEKIVSNGGYVEYHDDNHAIPEFLFWFSKEEPLKAVKKVFVKTIDLKTIPLDSLAQFPELEELDYYGSDDTEGWYEDDEGRRNPFFAGSAFSKLDSMELSAHTISPKTVEAIGRLSNLKSLKLTGNRDTTLNLNGISNSTQLESLELWRIGGLSEPPVFLNNFHRLEKLDIYDSPNAAIVIQCATECVNLKTLCLSNTVIGSELLEHLGKLNRLETLQLDYTNVDDDGVKHILHLKSLVKLDLDHTEVSDQGLARLTVLARLEELQIRQTSITFDAARRLMLELKSLKLIEHDDWKIMRRNGKVTVIRTRVNVG